METLVAMAVSVGLKNTAAPTSGTGSEPRHSPTQPPAVLHGARNTTAGYNIFQPCTFPMPPCCSEITDSSVYYKEASTLRAGERDLVQLWALRCHVATKP
eukprot:m.524542 g.524542  ORF g.524542 m.524542 type:complete len:100 (-) comp21989_c0_seq3:3748-4047(-)